MAFWSTCDKASRVRRSSVWWCPSGYCPADGYFCMVEGVDRVLGVGDRIGSVRILGIDSEKVEFAKDGVTWSQALGASPKPFWE